MTSWAFSNEPLALSEAFAGLECKKGDATTGSQEWVRLPSISSAGPPLICCLQTARRDGSRSFEGLVSLVAPKAGVAHGSFAVGEIRMQADGAPDTKVAMLSS